VGRRKFGEGGEGMGWEGVGWGGGGGGGGIEWKRWDEVK